MNTIRFKTYSKSKLKYKLFDILGGLGFLSILILTVGQKTKNEFIERNSVFLVFLFIVGFSWLIIRLFIGKTKWFDPIFETGEIEFHENSIVIKEKRIELKEIKKIRINAMYCKGQAAGGRSGISDGTGNYIEIFFRDNSKLIEKFVVYKFQDSEELKLLMDRWKQMDIVIIGEWKPFLHIIQK